MDGTLNSQSPGSHCSSRYHKLPAAYNNNDTVFIKVQSLALGPQICEAIAQKSSGRPRKIGVSRSSARNSGQSQQPPCNDFDPVARRDCCKASSCAALWLFRFGGAVVGVRCLTPQPERGRGEAQRREKKARENRLRVGTLNPFPSSCSARTPGDNKSWPTGGNTQAPPEHRTSNIETSRPLGLQRESTAPSHSFNASASPPGLIN